MSLISASKQQDFFLLFEKYITDSKTVKRLQPNGKPFTAGTIANYTATMNMIKAFSETKSFPMIELKNEAVKAQKQFRFCDVASTHTMRRTAITTMLCLGMPEQIVRRVSGHAPNSKEFYRYVLWAQTYQGQKTEKAFDKLKTKVSQPV